MLSPKHLEVFASLLTLVALWFVSEKAYIIGFGLSAVACAIWVYWCYHFRFMALLSLEVIMLFLYTKSLLGVI